MDGDGPWIMSSSNASGGPSSRRTSISMTIGTFPRQKTACRPISDGITRNASINPWRITPPSRFIPAASPWSRRPHEESGPPKPKNGTSETHPRDPFQGEQESGYELFSPKNNTPAITLFRSISCLDNGEHFTPLHGQRPETRGHIPGRQTKSSEDAPP